jgi:hypothetical protein
MKRWIPFIALGAALVLVVAGAAYLWTGDGPDAVTVGDQSVPQRDVDAELQELAENEVIQQQVEAAQAQGEQASPLSVYEGSVISPVSSGWVSLIVAQTVAAQEADRRGITATAADAERARDLAVLSVGGSEVFTTLSQSFQDDLVARWAPVAALERTLIADPPQSLTEAAQSLCPSGRFVSHILVQTEAEAQAIKQALDSGTDFATAAQSNSLDGSAQDGGQLGCLDDSQFVEPFATVAATQPVDVVSEPVQTEFGYHLILVTDDLPEAQLEQVTLEEVLGAARGRRVTVDKRYGRWDRANGQVLPPVTGTSVPATG